MTTQRALIVIDVQNEYFDGVLQIQYPPREQTLANITRAMDTAAELGMPVIVLQHEYPEGAPVFAVNSPSWDLHPDIESRVKPEFKRATKDKGSAFTGAGVPEFLAEHGVETVSIVGYMTNNCDIATAADAEIRGFGAEVLSDASGAIHLANDAGSASAEQVHTTLMTLLNSNFAAVATTDAWIEAARSGAELPQGDLGSSALQGRAEFDA